MTLNPFHRKHKEPDYRRFWEKATFIPSAEGAWPRSPDRPSTLEENLALLEEIRRDRATYGDS